MALPAVPIVFGGLMAWSIYRRVKRNIGRQKLRPRRIIASLVIISLVSVLLFSVTQLLPKNLLGLGGGMLCGALLGFAGLKLTKFETTDEGHFYKPNTHIGLALSLLFVGRIIYRMWALHNVMDGQPQVFQSPLTFFIIGLNLGYGLTYYTGLLIHTHDRK